MLLNMFWGYSNNLLKKLSSYPSIFANYMTKIVKFWFRKENRGFFSYISIFLRFIWEKHKFICNY